MTHSLKIPAAWMLAVTFAAPARAERKEIWIDATHLAAPEIRSAQPIARKWWLRRDAQDWGASRGTILMTGKPSGKTGEDGLHKVTPSDRFVSYRVPQLVVDPEAIGWYRVYVGLYHQGENPQARLLGRLSDEPSHLAGRGCYFRSAKLSMSLHCGNASHGCSRLLLCVGQDCPTYFGCGSAAFG